MIINSRSPQSLLLAEELSERVDLVPVYQETEEEPVWEILGGGKDDVYVYDRCGRLSYYIPLPLSVLAKQYVAAAVLSAYFTDPCGVCDEHINENQANTTGGNSTLSEVDESEWDESSLNDTLTEAHNITTEKPHRRKPHPGHHPHRHQHHHHHHHHHNNSQPHHHNSRTHEHQHKNHSHGHHHHKQHGNQGHEHQGHDHTDHSHTNHAYIEHSSLEAISTNEADEKTGEAESVEIESFHITTLGPLSNVEVTETIPSDSSTAGYKATRKPNRQHRRGKGSARPSWRRGRGDRNRTRDAPESRVKRSQDECHTLVNTTRCREYLPKFHTAKQCCRMGANNRIHAIKSKKCEPFTEVKCIKILKLKECCRRFHPNRNHRQQTEIRQNTVTPTPTATPSYVHHMHYCTGFTPSTCLTIYRLGFTHSHCCSEDDLRSNYTPLLSVEMCQYFDSELCSKLRHSGLHHRCCNNRTPKEDHESDSK